MKTSPPGFQNRQEAGRQLAERLRTSITGNDALILALPRGGVPVAAEIARVLGQPLDVLIVRKLGAPGHEELAMGALASGGITVLNPPVLAHLKLNPQDVDVAVARETRELQRREKLYRADRPYPSFKDKVIVIIDDGIATGSTMSAAVQLVRKSHPARIIVAVPVAPAECIDRLRTEADDVVILLTPASFTSVSRWYDDFRQTTDEEVRALLDHT